MPSPFLLLLFAATVQAHIADGLLEQSPPSPAEKTFLPFGCSSFTVGGCSAAEDEVLDTYINIPDPETCQTLCHIMSADSGCKFFTHSATSGLCVLYHERFLNSCNIIAGPADPTIAQCTKEDSSTCDSFIQEDCDYLGEQVLLKTGIQEPHTCQELLVTLGPIYGAEYFSFSRNSQLCVLYDSALVTCQAVSGPVEPKLDSCGGTSTTVGTTATTTIHTTTPPCNNMLPAGQTCPHSGEHGPYPDPADCVGFWMCEEGCAIKIQCLEGFLYDMGSKDCQESSTVDCGPRPCGSEEHCPCVDRLPSPQQNIRCDATSGPDVDFYPDLEDCSRFFNCTQGCFTHHQCGNDYLYRPERQWCDVTYQVDCGARPCLDPDRCGGQSPATTTTGSGPTPSPTPGFLCEYTCSGQPDGFYGECCSVDGETCKCQGGVPDQSWEGCKEGEVFCNSDNPCYGEEDGYEEQWCNQDCGCSE